MTNKKQKTIGEEHLAKSKAQNLSISTKHCIEICNHLRYKNTTLAKKILEETIGLKRAIPFKRFKRAVGHKPGMAAGRFPQKAAKEVLDLIKSVETNAQFKGLNTSNLKIVKLLANKAAIPLTGGRQRTATKRTHLEIEVKESREKKKKDRKTKSVDQPKETKKETKEVKKTTETKKGIKEVVKEPKELKTDASIQPQTEETAKTPETTPQKEEIKETPEKKEQPTQTGETKK